MTERVLTDLINRMYYGGYLHPVYGVASNQPHTVGSVERNCDNYFLFTAHLVMQMGLRGEPVTGDYRDAVAGFFKQTEVRPGLHARFPGRTMDDVSQDEIIGQAYLCLRLGFRDTLDAIIDWGFAHEWCYNVVAPDTWAGNYCYERHPYFKPFLLECWNQMNPEPRGLEAPDRYRIRKRNTFNLGHALQWAGVLYDDEKVGRGDSDGKQRLYLQRDVMKGRHCVTDLEIKRWERAVKRNSFPGGPRDFMSEYFGETYPLARAAPVDFT